MTDYDFKSKEGKELLRWRIALCSLTPGGSEYVGDPDYCVKVVREIRWHGKPIAKEKRAWGLVVKGAGLGDDVTPHVMKHTATTWLLQSGMELWDISGLVGTSLKTIEKTYGHQDADYQRAAAGAFIRKRA